MIDYTSLYEAMKNSPLEPWLEILPQQVEQALSDDAHGDVPRWLEVLAQLPHVTASSVDLQAGKIRIGEPDDCDDATRQKIENLLKKFHPWRKGPYNVHGIHIDTEWRSDWKWERLENHIEPLTSRRVLDVGCGNGYHAWRMAGAGAELVVGIDPTQLFVMQYQAIRHFIGEHGVYVLPLGIEALPPSLNAFDTVFSMGVLYHRRSPIDHIMELRGALRSGGQLVLETLVIEGGPGTVLVPDGRYAKMRNVWFIPTPVELERWLKRCGFQQVQCVDVTVTSVEEQRSTDWMTFESLSDYLNPDDPTLTVEGLPAPCRAVFTAIAP